MIKITEFIKTEISVDLKYRFLEVLIDNSRTREVIGSDKGFKKMKWSTHRQIARFIARFIPYPSFLTKELVEGSTDPDINKDRPHHQPDPNCILKYIWDAREAFHENDLKKAFRNLGRACHYIQDMLIENNREHNSLEESLRNERIRDDLIEEGFQQGIHSYRQLKNIIFKRIGPLKSPKQIMKDSCEISALVAKAVISKENPPGKLIDDFLSAKRRYHHKTLPFSLLISLILLFISLATHNFPISPLFLVASILCGFLIPQLDPDYNYLKQEMNWYGCSKIVTLITPSLPTSSSLPYLES